MCYDIIQRWLNMHKINSTEIAWPVHSFTTIKCIIVQENNKPDKNCKKKINSIIYWPIASQWYLGALFVIQSALNSYKTPMKRCHLSSNIRFSQTLFLFNNGREWKCLLASTTNQSLTYSTYTSFTQTFDVKALSTITLKDWHFHTR